MEQVTPLQQVLHKEILVEEPVHHLHTQEEEEEEPELLVLAADLEIQEAQVLKVLLQVQQYIILAAAVAAVKVVAKQVAAVKVAAEMVVITPVSLHKMVKQIQAVVLEEQEILQVNNQVDQELSL